MPASQKFNYATIVPIYESPGAIITLVCPACLKLLANT